MDWKGRRAEGKVIAMFSERSVDAWPENYLLRTESESRCEWRRTDMAARDSNTPDKLPGISPFYFLLAFFDFDTKAP
jgi:hypothetical protein